MCISFSLGPCLGHVCLLTRLLGHSPITFLFHFLVPSLGLVWAFCHWAFGSILAKMGINKYQRNNKLEKIDWSDLLTILNKHTLISHIEFVISDEFKDVGIKVFLFIKVVKEILLQVSMVILHHFKIRGRVFCNKCVQVSISISLNPEDKIHLEGEGNVMN